MTPKIEVTIQGSWRAVQIEAIVDTGFAGMLCLPVDVAVWVGAEIAAWGVLELADGSRARTPRVRCEVELLGVSTPVLAFVTDIHDPLIGTELLDDCKLTVDFSTGTAHLKRQ